MVYLKSRLISRLVMANRNVRKPWPTKKIHLSRKRMKLTNNVKKRKSSKKSIFKKESSRKSRSWNLKSKTMTLIITTKIRMKSRVESIDWGISEYRNLGISHWLLSWQLLKVSIRRMTIFIWGCGWSWMWPISCTSIMPRFRVWSSVCNK